MTVNRLNMAPAGEVVTGALGAVNSSVGGAVDALNYQSASVQVAGTFVGTIVAQVSNDGVNWVTKQLISAAGGTVTSMTAATLAGADIGARYFRVLMTAWTSGSAAVTLEFSAASIANSLATQSVAGTITANPNQVEQAETTANLAANGVYTGASRDMGTTVASRRTLLRPLIMHNAGTTPGTLVLEESTDGTTWRETRRTPVPSDASFRSFEWPLHLRYYRLRFINGAAAQTGFFLQTVAVQGEGGTMDAKNNLSFLLSTAALGAGATFTGPALDLGDNHIWDTVRARVNLGTASSTATVTIQSSHDGTTWANSPAAQATATTAGIVALERPITERYIRIVVTNGATAQASNQISLALVSL